MIKTYISIPEEIEVFEWRQYDNSTWIQAGDFIGLHNLTSDGFGSITLQTSVGPRMLKDNSYIVKNIQGQFYLYEEDEFKRKFKEL